MKAIEFIKEGDDADLSRTMSYAKAHYPQYSKDKLKAFMKFVQRSLAHAKHDDRHQDNEIQDLENIVQALAQRIQRLEQRPVNEGTLSVDVPNEDWLQDKVDYAKSKTRNSFGVPFMGATTAYTNGVQRVPVDILKRLPGMRGEQKNVRQNDLQAIMKIMKDTGKLPLLDSGEEYAPFINVAYNGEAWVNEGNHRIMAAAALGWKDLPVQIKYFDGGERVESGPMYPGKIGLNEPKLGETVIMNVDENFADGKNPGRKGLAKRMGVNCKQPISKLRSIAANSSGERQRMAHWCANMKSGKQK